MTLLEKLQTHKGGLLRIKPQLLWYGGRGWDKNPGRICLLLDSDTAAAAVAAARTPTAGADAAAVALLLVDGSPRWIWVADKDVELLDGVSDEAG